MPAFFHSIALRLLSKSVVKPMLFYLYMKYKTGVCFLRLILTCNWLIHTNGISFQSDYSKLRIFTDRLPIYLLKIFIIIQAEDWQIKDRLLLLPMQINYALSYAISFKNVFINIFIKMRCWRVICYFYDCLHKMGMLVTLLLLLLLCANNKH